MRWRLGAWRPKHIPLKPTSAFSECTSEYLLFLTWTESEGRRRLSHCKANSDFSSSIKIHTLHLILLVPAM